MAAGEGDTPPVRGEDAGGAVQAHWYDWGLALDSRSLLRGRRAAPPWMRAELVRLQAAVPEFAFGICPGWRGAGVAGRRGHGTGGPFALGPPGGPGGWP